MPREIMIIRHGQAYNSVAPDGRRDVRDRTNPPLTPLGEAQAALAAEVVSEFAPQHVVVSPFLRVAQTALAYLHAIGAQGTLDVRMCEFFIYGSLKDFNGVDADHYAKLLGDALPVPEALTRRTGFPGFAETPEALVARIADLAADWTGRGDWRHMAFYGHGATVRGLIEALDASLTDQTAVPPHCSVTRLVETAAGGWKAAQLVDVSHLAELDQAVTGASVL